MIATTDLLLATVDRRAVRPVRPRVGWLSGGPRPTVVAIGRRLGIDVDVVDLLAIGPEVDVDGGSVRGAGSARDHAAPGWDVVTADDSGLGRGTSARLAALARWTGARCPNTVALGIVADPAAARAALAAAGFPVTSDGGPNGRRATVAVARRPSGWWRPVVPGRGSDHRRDRTAPDARVLELAVAAAAGLDVAGVLVVDVVVAGDLVLVDEVRLGPDPDDAAAVEAHLRGLLDLPLEADPAGLAR